MENKGILIGKIMEAPTAEPNYNKTRNNAVFNFVDLKGNVYSSLKAYGETADELFIHGKAGQCVSLHYSLTVRTQQQSQTGESVFSLFIRDVGISADNSFEGRVEVNNQVRVVGTLLENPVFKQENNQQVAYVKLSVVKRNLSLGIDKDSKTDTMVIVIRNQGDLNTLQYCGQGSRLSITGTVTPMPGSYIVMLEAKTLEVFSFKSAQNNMNSTFGNQPNASFNTGNVNQNNNSGVLRCVNGQVVDSNNQAIDPTTLPSGCYTTNMNNQVFITNANGQLINSNGEVINELGQRLDQNGQVINETINTNESTIGFITNSHPTQNQGNGAFGQQNMNSMSQAQNQGFNAGGQTNQVDTTQQNQGFGAFGQQNMNGMSQAQNQGFNVGGQTNQVDTSQQNQGFGAVGQQNMNGMTQPQTQGFNAFGQTNQVDATQTQGFGAVGQQNMNGMTQPQTQGFNAFGQTNQVDATQTQGFGAVGQQNMNGMAQPQTQGFNAFGQPTQNS